EAQQALRERAAGMKKEVDLERHSAELYADFDEAAKAKEPDVALSRFDAIPAASMYKARAQEALPDIKAQFVEAHLDLADAARTQGRCDDAREEVEKVEQLDPENRQAHDILKICRTKAVAHVAVAAVTPRPAPTPKLVRAAAPARPAVPFVDEFAPPPEPPADPAELIHQARTAWLHQQCSQAIELSRRALKSKANSNDAYQIIAVCSCSTKDRDSALKSYQRLDERNRAMVRSACAKYGIELEE
ncbi:MAG TPA: hypothetical protein VH328_13290, partial [Burkholderiaceae bacterium]|nr:hypothetical protein [Burkholderiaceae bacterium]